jgi:hypothetical protein
MVPCPTQANFVSARLLLLWNHTHHAPTTASAAGARAMGLRVLRGPLAVRDWRCCDGCVSAASQNKRINKTFSEQRKVDKETFGAADYNRAGLGAGGGGRRPGQGYGNGQGGPGGYRGGGGGGGYHGGGGQQQQGGAWIPASIESQRLTRSFVARAESRSLSERCFAFCVCRLQAAVVGAAVRVVAAIMVAAIQVVGAVREVVVEVAGKSEAVVAVVAAGAAGIQAEQSARVCLHLCEEGLYSWTFR